MMLLLRSLEDASQGPFISVCFNEPLQEFEHIALLCLGSLDGASRKLKDRVGRQTTRESPGRNGRLDLFDTMLPIDIDKIDRKPHEKGVNCFAWNDPHALALAEPFSSKESFRALCSGTRNFGFVCNQRVACKITNPHFLVFDASND
jgi:hypothetical protein